MRQSCQKIPTNRKIETREQKKTKKAEKASPRLFSHCHEAQPLQMLCSKSQKPPAAQSSEPEIFHLSLEPARTCLLPIGKGKLLLQIFLRSQQRSAFHNAQPANSDENRTSAKVCVGACAPPPLPSSLGGQTDRKLSLSRYPGWAEGSLKRHGRDSDGDAAIAVSERILPIMGRSVGSRAVWRIDFSFCFFVIRLVLIGGFTL